jgi:carbon storage regulator
MLVLTRRIGEEIVIAGDIHVTVVGVHGRQVRLGITAPLSVPVVRLELLAEDSPGGASPGSARNRQE